MELLQSAYNGDLCQFLWQDPAMRLLGILLFGHFGEAVAEGVDNEFESIRDFELGEN